MYQIVYPWINAHQFQIQIPKAAYTDLASEAEATAWEYLRSMQDTSKEIKFGAINSHMRIVADDADAGNPGITVHSASCKLMSFLNKRDAHVVFHDEDSCADKKPWNAYKHFHITYINHTRPGADSLWNNVVAQHKSLVQSTGNIPMTQVTKYPGSWANYLAQPPRQTWKTCDSPEMMDFSAWVNSAHVPRLVATTAGCRRALFREPGPPTEPTVITLKTGHQMSLYNYLKWQIATHGHSNHEDLISAALETGNAENFETCPHPSAV